MFEDAKYQVAVANRILLAVRVVAMGGLVERDARRLVIFAQRR